MRDKMITKKDVEELRKHSWKQFHFPNSMKWIAYPIGEDQQITVQETYGRGKAKGNYEAIYFPDTNPYHKLTRAKTIGYTKTFNEAQEEALHYLKSHLLPKSKEKKKLAYA